MRLDEMYDMAVPVTVDWYGTPVECKVRPGRLTAALAVAAEQASDWDAFAEQVKAVVAEWDVTDENGERLPVTDDTIRRLPALFVGAVIRAAVEEVSSQGRG